MKNFFSWILVGLLLALCYRPTHQIRAECELSQKYVIPNFKGNWYKAMEYCHYLGLKLTTVPSMDEQVAIVKAIEGTDKGNGTTFWTGGNDLGDYQNYHWYSTGSRIMWFNWGKSDPYDSRRGNCVQLLFEKASSEWKWDTDECSNAKYFVCEKV